MSMQAYYNLLVSSDATSERYLRVLVRLARASLPQILAVRSELVWEFWRAEDS